MSGPRVTYLLTEPPKKKGGEPAVGRIFLIRLYEEKKGPETLELKMKEGKGPCLYRRGSLQRNLVVKFISCPGCFGCFLSSEKMGPKKTAPQILGKLIP